MSFCRYNAELPLVRQPCEKQLEGIIRSLLVKIYMFLKFFFRFRGVTKTVLIRIRPSVSLFLSCIPNCKLIMRYAETRCWLNLSSCSQTSSHCAWVWISKWDWGCSWPHVALGLPVCPLRHRVCCKNWNIYRAADLGELFYLCKPLGGYFDVTVLVVLKHQSSSTP